MERLTAPSSAPHDVAGAAHRVQQARRAVGLDLLAQPVDEHLDQVRQRVVVIAPDVLGEHACASPPRRRGA